MQFFTRYSHFIICCLIFIFSSEVQVNGSGKMFWRSGVQSGGDCCQQAILYFEEQTETLIIQSKLSIKANDEQIELGWIIPTPGIPEIGTAPAEETNRLLRLLNQHTRPIRRYILSEIYQYVIVSLVVLCVAVIPFSIFISINDRFQTFRKPLLKSLAVFVMASLTLLSVLPSSLKQKKEEKVEVLSGIEARFDDINVIKSDEAERLIIWLNQNKFNYSSDDIELFEFYRKQEWSFVLVKLSFDFEQVNPAEYCEGVTTPLVLKFQHNQPVYPSALKGPEGCDNKNILYLISDSKWTSNGRMNLKFAGANLNSYTILKLMSDTEPQGLFDKSHLTLNYLCKFTDKKIRGEANNICLFEKTKNNVAFKEEIIQW